MTRQEWKWFFEGFAQGLRDNAWWCIPANLAILIYCYIAARVS